VLSAPDVFESKDREPTAVLLAPDKLPLDNAWSPKATLLVPVG